jgi:hypothetical protein
MDPDEPQELDDIVTWEKLTKMLEKAGVEAFKPTVFQQVMSENKYTPWRFDKNSIIDVETGHSAAERPKWVVEGWSEELPEKPPTADNWQITCYYCGKVCESPEALEEHEDGCE